MTYSSRIFLISLGLGTAGARRVRLVLLDLLGDDVVAEADALVADVDAWARR
jgi:DNA-binding ferritin-like protein (Dps family)